MDITGCCGMDCSSCEARLATLRNDMEALSKIAAAEENRSGHSFILPSRMRCTGCMEPGAKSISCAECRIRICAEERSIPHCGFCEEFPCDLGDIIWEAIPEYKKNIERIRSR
ncbi:MAG: DUF3795 domain-containing protein [Synergistaceae bacterium]|nr:DUF3795 domain-containing protein [Synergistaceae bacterium]